MVRNLSSSRTQLLPTRPKRLRSGCGGTFRHLSAPRFGPRESRPEPPGLQTVGCFGGHGLLKASQQPGQSEEIPCESSGRYPPEDGACCDSRVAGGFQGLRRGRGQPF